MRKAESAGIHACSAIGVAFGSTRMAAIIYFESLVQATRALHGVTHATPNKFLKLLPVASFALHEAADRVG